MTDHVDDATWERLAMGELDAAARARVADHVTRCASCAALWRGLAMLEDGARDFDPGVPAASRPVAPRRWWPMAAAVAAVAAALLLWIAVRPRSAPPVDDVRRGSAEPAVIGVVAPAAHAGAPIALAWAGVAGADAYVIEVFTADGTRAWRGEAAAPGATAPALPAGDYRWRVEARHGGVVIGRSRLEPLPVTPP